MVVLGGGAVSYERGTPVALSRSVDRNFEVDVLGVWYKFVNFGVEKSLFLPNSSARFMLRQSQELPSLNASVSRALAWSFCYCVYRASATLCIGHFWGEGSRSCSS